MTNADEAVRALAEQVQALEQVMSQQQQTITVQQQMIAHQEAALAALQAQVEETNHKRETEAASGRRGTKTSRRSLLKMGGIAAAAATGAALVASEQTAHASPLTDGGNLVIGTATSAEARTTLYWDGTSTIPGSMLQILDNAASNVPTEGSVIAGLVGASSPSENTIGVTGYSEYVGGYGVQGAATSGYGVYTYTGDMTGNYAALYATNEGAGDGADIFGANNANGVKASVGGTAGNGVEGDATGTSGYGVWGMSDSGYGVVGQASTGIDLFAGGTGRILQSLETQVGSPSGDHFGGESIRDANGDLWLCLSGNGTTAGIWARVTHVVPGATGGATSYLSKPIRLLDTRSGVTDAKNNGGGPYAAGSTHTLTVAGVTFNGVTVPSPIAGAMGKITATDTAGGGYVALLPHGVAFSGTSNLPFGPGETVAIWFNSALVSGKLDIYIGGSATDIVLDLFAVVA